LKVVHTVLYVTTDSYTSGPERVNVSCPRAAIVLVNTSHKTHPNTSTTITVHMVVEQMAVAYGSRSVTFNRKVIAVVD